MAHPSGDARYAAGAIWESPSGLRVVIVAAPDGFLLVSWPPAHGMLTHVLDDGEWTIPDKQALAYALAHWRYVGVAGEDDSSGK